jgi:hypothetical protein
MILGRSDEPQPDIENPNQSEKKRCATDGRRMQSLETSTDTTVDFCTEDEVKDGMDVFGSKQLRFTSIDRSRRKQRT